MAPLTVALPSVTEVEPFTVPDPLMVPDPVGVSVTAVPDNVTPVPTVIGLFVPELIKESVEVAVMLLLVTIPPAAESVKLIVDPVEAPLDVIAVVSVMLTAALVLNVILGVATVEVIAPVAPAASRVTEVVPPMVPEPVSAPPPVAEILVVVPEIAALRAMLLLFVIERLPPDVMVFVKVLEAPEVSVIVSPPVPAVDTPFPVMACESVKVIEPAEPVLCVVVILGVISDKLPIVAVPALIDTAVVPVMVPLV